MGVRPLAVVDMANVMGSRPDGWWRDRSGAAAKLLARMAELAGREHGVELVVVLEGAARKAAPAGERDGIRVVHAEGSGDDAIVAEVRAVRDDPHGANRRVTVVTADRELRGRVCALGAAVTGPSTLLDKL